MSDASQQAPSGAPTPYIRRMIDVTLSLGTGAFGESGYNTVKLSGYRVSVTVVQASFGAPTTLSCRIWGVRKDLMMKLATIGREYEATRKNTVMVEAGDAVAGMQQIYYGIINDAYFDGNSQPDVAFQVEASNDLLSLLKPTTPISSATGVIDVASTMADLANQMGLQFENHGVSVKLRDVYFPGTAAQQARRITDAAGISYVIENGVLAIWPYGQARVTGTIPLITPLSGMKDYPTFNSQGIIFTCLFRILKIGQAIVVRSSLWDDDPDIQARIWFLPGTEQKTFHPIAYTYALESEAPNGPWFTTVRAGLKPLGSN